MLDRERVGRVRILVAGDAMLDRYWFGTVERISPEAPVPIVRVDEVDERAGGAANVAMNVASIGAQCTLVGVVGDDEAGERLGSLLNGTSIRPRFAVDHAGKTVTKLRVVSQNQQLIRADFDGRPSEDVLVRYMELYESALDDADVVVMSDYGKGGLSHIEKMIAAANVRSKPVLVDPKGTDFGRYANATIVTPNLTEFEAVAGKVRDDEDLKDKALALLRDLNVHGILVTRGRKGMVLVEKEEQWFDFPAVAKEVYDVSGAGDTVIAAFGVGYALALPLETSVRLANTAAGVVVGKLGTATASLDEINAVAAQQESRGRS
ncbi:MAG: D-glycero-beta-D-manno-heptose-7-phosphate kinase [Arenicellales bacterium]|jgi:rfaE bifunctional protein kinase chain/domain